MLDFKIFKLYRDNADINNEGLSCGSLGSGNKNPISINDGYFSLRDVI